MESYCQDQGLSIDQLKWSFNGQLVTKHQTPEELNMKDEDGIVDLSPSG